MSQFGGKDSKRHFTVVMGGKEHGLYVSSTPSSAARKAVTKLCAANKSKKVEFHIREITQGSKKKTYGPYEGYIEKLKEPIELKGRIIKYKPVAKLSGKTGVKKGGMKGGDWIDDLQGYNPIEKEYMKEFWDMLKTTKNNSIKKEKTLIINQKYPQIHKNRKEQLRQICIKWSKRNWIDELDDFTEIEKQYIRYFYDLQKSNPTYFLESYKYADLYPEIMHNRKRQLNKILSEKKYRDLLNSYFRTPITQRPDYDPRRNQPYNPAFTVNNNNN
jgi:hypothetical protein